MIKIGEIELRGELTTIPLDKLVEDVPVTDKHVQNLANSIRAVGQVSPLVIWSEDHRIIDGFHRVQAMKLAEKKEATCLLYSCDEETFWNLRILNAVTHRAVHFARVVGWVKKSFAGTKWAQKMGAEDAFRVGRRGAAAHLSLTPVERQELTEWVREKSRLWNLPAYRIGRMLRITNLADPDLIREVRDEEGAGVITQSILEAIVTKLVRHDLQQAITQKAKVEKLPLRDVEDLVKQLVKAQTEEDREELLRTVYQRPKGGRPLKSALQSLQQLRANLITESFQQLIFILPHLEQPQPFDEKLPEIFEVMAHYLGKEDITALDVLQEENQSLKEENRSLEEKLQKLSEELKRRDKLIESQTQTIARQIEQINTLIRRD